MELLILIILWFGLVSIDSKLKRLIEIGENKRGSNDRK